MLESLAQGDRMEAERWVGMAGVRSDLLKSCWDKRGDECGPSYVCGVDEALYRHVMACGRPEG
jgi:hypothetical protein